MSWPWHHWNPGSSPTWQWDHEQYWNPESLPQWTQGFQPPGPFLATLPQPGPYPPPGLDLPPELATQPQPGADPPPGRGAEPQLETDVYSGPRPTEQEANMNKRYSWDRFTFSLIALA